MIQLKEGETLIREVHISKAGIIVLWLAVPVFLLITLGATYLPGLLSYAASSAMRNALMDMLGVEHLSMGDIVGAVGAWIPSWLKIVFWIFMTPLIVLWFGWCLVATYQNTRYSLCYTDQRVVATAKGEEFTAPVSELKQVFVGQSIFGKLFKYGEVTIEAKKGSVTVKNITQAMDVKRDLLRMMEEQED